MVNSPRGSVSAWRGRLVSWWTRCTATPSSAWSPASVTVPRTDWPLAARGRSSRATHNDANIGWQAKAPAPPLRSDVGQTLSSVNTRILGAFLTMRSSINRFRPTCRVLLQLGRFANEAYEDSRVHRRRGQNVLRQLPARQRAGRGAQTAGPRRHSAAAVHAHAHRRIERQRAGSVAERDQRLPGPASRLFPQDPSPAGPSMGCAVDAEARLPNLHRGGPAYAGRHDGFHAARRGGLPAQGDPQAERVAKRMVEA